MSKNNAQEYVRKMEPQRQRFGLRKLSVGVASVLLGTTFMVGGTVAHADSTPTTQEATAANADITQSASTSVVQADKQTNGEQNLVENTSSNSQKEQQLVNKTSNESTDQLNNEKNQELVNDNEYESITNLNKNNVNTQNTPVEESKVSQSTTEQNARIDLTFVDDDDNGKIVDYSYLPSEDNGHHYAYGKVGDKVSPKAYNNGTMSIKRMLDILDIGYYEPAGAYQDQAPKEFTSSEMSFQIHLKHQTEQKVYHTYNLTRNIHYRYTSASNGETMQDDQGKEVPDYKVQYQITPTVIFDLVTNKVKNGVFNVKNLTTGETFTFNSQANRLKADNFDPIKSPDVSQRWKPEESEIAASFNNLPDLDNWQRFFNGAEFNDNQTVNYKVDYTQINIGDYVPNNQVYFNTDIEVSSDGTKETVYRYFYYGMSDENDEGVNIDHVTKQHYGGRQALEFTRTKTVDTDGQVTYGKWTPVTTDTFPEYIYKDNYQVKGYDGQYAHAPAVKYDPNDPMHNGGMSVFDPYAPLYKVSIIDDVTGETLNTYEKNPVPEAGDDYQYTRDRAEKTCQSIYDQVDEYKSKGYTVASDDFGSISINNAANAKHSEGTEDDAKYVYTIHLTTNKAIAHTDTKTATRTIHYVANDENGKQLQDDTTQNVTLTSSIYYTDAVTGQRVNARQNINGEWFVDALNNSTLPAITWTVNADRSTGLTTDDKNFAAIITPETITLSTDEAAKRGTDDGEWYLVSNDKNGEVSYGDPNSDNWQIDTTNKIADGYLIYKQKAQYNIHYIDVNGVEDKTAYAPTDGHELTDHLVPNVGEGKGIFVGDTPDATSKLWSPADYEKAGYVLVGLSDNAKGDLLGKQTLTKGVQDQYVYLKHAVKDITPNTPVDDVPKDPDGKRAIDPSDLHKEFTRTITFVANNDAKSPLKDAVPQKVTFDGHVYVDMVTGQTTTPETVKDANGKTTQVATTKAGNIEWNHDTQTMDEVVQKYITLNKGDKYATSDDMVGTWHWISGVANEITLKPTSNNPEDLVLVYEKNKGESGPESSYKLPQLDYGKSGPSTDYDLPKLDYGQSGPSTDYDLPKLDYGQSGPSTDYDLPKLDYGQSGPSTDYDLPKLDYGQSGPSTDYDLPKLDYGQSGPSTDYDLPKLDYGQSGPSTDYDLPKLDYGQSGPSTDYDLPKAEIPSQPTEQPTEQPTSQPTVQPTEQPTSQPTAQPTEQPTSQPTAQPTEQPTSQPTAQPTEQPTSQPTAQPTEQPTSQPTEQPTSQPTAQPTAQPSEQPAIESNTQLPGEQKNEEPQPMTTQVNTKEGETSIVEPTSSSSTQPTTKQGAQQLPQTGNQKSSSLIGLGFAGLLSALGLTKVNKKRKD
ncbi:YSIRK-type signal peptide-containing protein [Limosilactobacillus reuteri]|uniref:YSIRK-type signal peptide-containing protein n=1 Tax=Limosilactobacillus reuteri TaxID=1598 RepID=UPI00226FF338|nr:PT domain-containing protein [Limosilactobacillus reuteri]